MDWNIWMLELVWKLGLCKMENRIDWCENKNSKISKISLLLLLLAVLIARYFLKNSLIIVVEFVFIIECHRKDVITHAILFFVFIIECHRKDVITHAILYYEIISRSILSCEVNHSILSYDITSRVILSSELISRCVILTFCEMTPISIISCELIYCAILSCEMTSRSCESISRVILPYDIMPRSDVISLVVSPWVLFSVL